MLKGNNWREKLDYFWYYYKYHTLVGLLVLFVVLFSVFGGGGGKPSALNVFLFGQTVNDQARTQLEQQATAALLPADEQKSKEVSIQFFPVAGTLMNPANQAAAEKVMAETAARDLDVLILAKTDFQAYAAHDAFYNLDAEVKAWHVPQSMWMKVKDQSTGQTHVYGIDLSHSPFLKRLDYGMTPPVMGIVANTTRLPLAEQFIQWFVAAKSS